MNDQVPLVNENDDATYMAIKLIENFYMGPWYEPEIYNNANSSLINKDKLRTNLTIV